MAETANIAKIAEKLSEDIFKHFRWRLHPLKNVNFDCVNSGHEASDGSPKKSHPGDAVFYYDDPYSDKTIYLHTDLKSYKKSNIKPGKVRDAFRSMCMTVECACQASAWREKYSVNDDDRHEVRGFLFVHSHDGKNAKLFAETLQKIDLNALPVAANTVIHYIGPDDIQRLYSVSNDILRLVAEGVIDREYTFFYPDLVMARKVGGWRQPATFESLMGPYLILSSPAKSEGLRRYVVYYNRPCGTPQEIEYLLDCLSHFQLLDRDVRISIRISSVEVSEDYKSNFQTACRRYVRAWGFDPERQKILEDLAIEKISAVTSTYSPGDFGWDR